METNQTWPYLKQSRISQVFILPLAPPQVLIAGQSGKRLQILELDASGAGDPGVAISPVLGSFGYDLPPHQGIYSKMILFFAGTPAAGLTEGGNPSVPYSGGIELPEGKGLQVVFTGDAGVIAVNVVYRFVPA